ncbi:MAG: ABC transporter permease [Bacteroidota bacterium]
MLFLTLLKESILFALNALKVNRLRTFLSLLGITIGIFAIISVFTVVDSLEKNMRDSIKSLGDNVVFVQKWPWTFGPDYPWWKYMNRPVPDVKELQEIQRRSRKSETAAFLISFQRTVKRRNSSVEGASIVAVSHDYSKVQTLNIANGRYFTESESAGGRAICVIGATIAEGLFPNEDPVGKDIKVRGLKIRVIGVLKKQGESILGNNQDGQVIIPVNYVRNLVDIRDERFEPMIMVKARPGVTNDELIDELTGIMRQLRKLKPMADDNFALNQTSLISTQFDSLFDVIGTAGWIIGGFSILVGGFGIANIMFVSVKERTSQIGIQKSLGAKNYFILMQFLAESVFLCLIGGGLGLIIIYAGTLMVGDSFGMEIALSLPNVILGLTISALIGIVSGFVPAYSASQLDPVEAIRAN